MPAFFDTLRVTTDAGRAAAIHDAAEARGMNFRRVDETAIGIALDETATQADLSAILDVFAEASGRKGAVALAAADDAVSDLPPALRRTSRT